MRTSHPRSTAPRSTQHDHERRSATGRGQWLDGQTCGHASRYALNQAGHARREAGRLNGLVLGAGVTRGPDAEPLRSWRLATACDGPFGDLIMVLGLLRQSDRLEPVRRPSDVDATGEVEPVVQRETASTRPAVSTRCTTTVSVAPTMALASPVGGQPVVEGLRRAIRER
jgi:hypothetical protein